MRTELPVFKRCCFCLPLRYGLITWGYLKLTAAVVMSIAIIFTLISLVEIAIRYGNPNHIQHIVVMTIVLIILLIDVVLNTLFIVGGHTKNARLLQVYYIYNIVLWALTIALVVVMGFLMMPTLGNYHVMSYRTWLLLIDFSSSFVNIVMQSYFLLLLRSEIIKLRNNCEFRFVNNAAEAECVMQYNEGLVDEEKGTEDSCQMGTSKTEYTCEKTCQSNGNCHNIEEQN